MASWYKVHETNPNDQIGGGGCLASGANPDRECGGKWINFFRVSTEFNNSPYAVICENHLHEVVENYDLEETLPAGDVLPVRETKRLVR